MEQPIIIGAVAYDPRVVPTWEGMRDYFREIGPPIDYLLFSNYDRQVRALLKGQIDIAWNTNLAWAKVHHLTGGRCRALAMRDVDARFETVVVVRADRGIESLADLRGKRLALGSADSAQAAILPIHYLQQLGLQPGSDYELVRFNVDVGKHGDTGTSELEVLAALADGRADAGALGKPTWVKQVGQGRADARLLRAIWTSPGYCHCNFTAVDTFPEERSRHWTRSLLAMSYDQPRWRQLMDLEGLKSWIPVNADVLVGYSVLLDAVEQQQLSRSWQME